MNTTYVKTKYRDFAAYAGAENKPGLEGEVATQLMWLYRKTAEKSRPQVLELGTEVGTSTTMFLQACEEQDGNTVSIDITDCSDLSDSPRWQFVQSDSTNVDYILSKAPQLKRGIDIIYIDSLHTRAHVEKEVTGWYPYLNEGAWLFFDDVDAQPYRKGSRKDALKVELANDGIHEFVLEFFYANEDGLHLNILYGSTGLACLRKLTPLGTIPAKAAPIVRRPNNFINQTTLSVAAMRKRMKNRKNGA